MKSRSVRPGSSRIVLTRASEPGLPSASGDPVIGNVTKSRMTSASSDCATAGATSPVLTASAAAKQKVVHVGLLEFDEVTDPDRPLLLDTLSCGDASQTRHGARPR